MQTRALAAVLPFLHLACGPNKVVVGVPWDAGERAEAMALDAAPTTPGTFVPGTVAILAGTLSGKGSADGKGADARFFSPAGVAVDTSGNVLVADTSNHTIRKITPAGIVSTFAGVPGSAGNEDGTSTTARFDTPYGVAVDGEGNVFVADTGNSTIRKISPAGAVTTFAGAPGLTGDVDGIGARARFRMPLGLAVDGVGNVIVADSGNDTIRMITPAGSVTTLAGTPGAEGSANGTGPAAHFHYPTSVAVDGLGNVFVGDTSNHTIRKITPAGVVSTFAGAPGAFGTKNGAGDAARFTGPAGLAVDGTGNLFVADFGSNTIRKITPDGVVTTPAGKPGSAGSVDGPGTEARFNHPSGVALAGTGNLIVADYGNDTIRMITPTDVVTTLAGTVRLSGSADGGGDAAHFSQPWGLAVDSAGNVFVADTFNDTIRRISPGGIVTTLAGKAGSEGAADGIGVAASFNRPYAVTVDGTGNVFVADTFNNTIRRISPEGVVSTLAGKAGSFGTSDGIGIDARFDSPRGVAVDGAGNVFVADTTNNTIRRITAAGLVSTLAGRAGTEGATDGVGDGATFHHPHGIAVDAAGNVFVADTGNDAIRKIAPDGTTTTLARAVDAPASLDASTTIPLFSNPTGLAVGGLGNVIVADRDNNAIREITPAGLVRTIVGIAAPTTVGSVPGPFPASLNEPRDVAIDPSTGIIYIVLDEAVMVATP